LVDNVKVMVCTIYKYVFVYKYIGFVIDRGIKTRQRCSVGVRKIGGISKIR
jgi:hypothetical protein